jgi:hypothetical protein
MHARLVQRSRASGSGVRAGSGSIAVIGFLTGQRTCHFAAAITVSALLLASASNMRLPVRIFVHSHSREDPWVVHFGHFAVKSRGPGVRAAVCRGGHPELELGSGNYHRCQVAFEASGVTSALGGNLRSSPWCAKGALIRRFATSQMLRCRVVVCFSDRLAVPGVTGTRIAHRDMQHGDLPPERPNHLS